MENIFEKLPDCSSTEVFEELCSNGDIKLERIVSKGQATPVGEWLVSDKNEWVLLLKGYAKLTFKDGNLQEMQPGDYVFIPAHTFHRVDETSLKETIWLALHF